MRLSWSEIRTRAAAFADDWKEARDERRETQSFYDAFFQIFDVTRRRVATFEKAVDKLGGAKGFIDLFWPGTLIIEQKSRGCDLTAAQDQAMDYLHTLSDAEMPKFVLVSDFETFELTDLDTRETTAFTLKDLPQHIEKFGFILGRQKRVFRDQDPVNIKASELVGLLHDEIKKSGYTGHKLEQFLGRIVFCLFADDTGIFEPRDILWDYLDNRTAPDGSDMGSKLAELFHVLNTPPGQRQTTLDPDLARFPYVNGDLFAEYFPPPAFNADMRAALMNACNFDWAPISPAIFGSLFQFVMDTDQRRALGAHYTTEANILKVIEPLFLDDLRAEFETLKVRKTKRAEMLRAFHDKLAGLTFFDPACGCGNFLIIAYRELRLLEIEVLKELHQKDIERFKGGVSELPLHTFLKLNVDQFYGIEVEEFPARIAETALWMMDHIMNTEASLTFGVPYVRIPLEKSPHIHHGDALEIDWATLLAPAQCSYIMGNPPFVGQSFQSPAQREQMRQLTNPTGKTGSPLDYVGAWFLKAGAYGLGQNVPFGFVCTNSLTQGEQVALIWPRLFEEYKLEIAFAHRTFAWGSEARGKANVHVVIIGLEPREYARQKKRLFSYEDIKGTPEETQHDALSPYLFDASKLGNPYMVVMDAVSPISQRPVMDLGVKMVDFGHYTFSGKEKETFLTQEPKAENLFYKYIGGKEYINGLERWCLAFNNISPAQLRNLKNTKERIRLVKEQRAKSKKKATQKLAEFPLEYECGTIPDQDFIVVPNVSSERREYIPIGWLSPPTIPNQKLRVIPKKSSKWLFALLTSAMHMAWMRTVTGRMKSDYMYSVGVVYNTFPLPLGKDLTKLKSYGQAILDARVNHPGATLADLYDPDVMPADLRRAHQANDKAVDKLYSSAGFGSERDRVEHLFALYEKQITPMLAKPKKRRR